jgi:glycosyltransferase involved in cell wall biosynthesis
MPQISAPRRAVMGTSSTIPEKSYRRVSASSEPKVSVIIPTHNRAASLGCAIVSVLHQTFQDFEILVVDDASQDNTVQILSNFNDHRIKYIHHETNKGGSAARNTGIMLSSSRYIAFLDDDDEWMPSKLAQQIQAIENSPFRTGGIYTGYLIVDRETGRILGQHIPSKEGDLSSKLYVSNWIGGTSSVLLRRECFEKVGPFDEQLSSFQDYDMWIRIAKVFHFSYLRDPLLKYYVHGKKIWTNLPALSRGVDMMLAKYGHSRAFRKRCSYYYLALGVDYCYSNDLRRGRRAYLKAIKLHPLEPRHIFNLCLSFFGADNFRAIKELRDRYAFSRR